MPKVLVIDDEIQFIDSISPFLEMENHQVFSAMTAHQGLSLIEKEAPAVILLDVKLPGQKSGLDLIQCIRNIDKNIPIIMVSGMAEPETIVKAIQAGAADYMQKPFNAELLLDKVKDLAKSQSTPAANDETLHAVVFLGESPRMARLKDEARRVAMTSAPVLITGECGTGKSLLARFIHESGPLAKAPFLSINCAARENLKLEKDLALFSKLTDGNALERGGRTAATSLFLEEIGDLTLPLQGRLLEFLEFHEGSRLGDRKVPGTGARVIASTQHNPGSMLAEGRLREDLYFRLSVLSLNVPPLRERREDIPILANHFLKKYAAREGKNHGPIPPLVLQRFVAHPWMGNVRELENAVERAIVFAKGPTLTENDFVLQEGAALQHQNSETATGVSVSEIENHALVKALEETGGNISKAAKVLGLSRDTIYRRMRKYDIPIKKAFSDN